MNEEVIRYLEEQAMYLFDNIQLLKRTGHSNHLQTMIKLRVKVMAEKVREA